MLRENGRLWKNSPSHLEIGPTYTSVLYKFIQWVAWLMLPFAGAVQSVSARVYPRVFEMSSFLQCFAHTFMAVKTACSQISLGEMLRMRKYTDQEN